MPDKSSPAPKCKHCDQTMVKLEMPREAAYDSPFFWICFNDVCTYYAEGWEWMHQKYQVKSSYRHRIDPETGNEAPFPVWSKDAMRDRIIK